MIASIESPTGRIRDRVAALLDRLPREPQFPTQGRTIFVDLERRTTREAYTPLPVVRAFLEGRGANMFYLYNLLDESLEPLHPDIPLIFGSGLLTAYVPSAARGNCTSWSPESRTIMDSNIGDYFPSFMKLNRIDRLVIHGRGAWTYLYIREGRLEFRDAAPYVGLNNIDLRERIEKDVGGEWAKDLAMASIAAAGEKLVKTSGIMGGPKAIYARGATGAKMGAHKLKAIVVHGFVDFDIKGADTAAIKPYNRIIAKTLLDTGVVKHALSIRGTPFLYKPSRLLGAMGTKNHQETTWTGALDAENFDPFRPGMEGCFRCPVNCRPTNDLHDQGKGDRYDAGDGPEYVTLGKFGPNIGIKDPKQVMRLNNICNDLGMDTASTGSAISWAIELFQRGIIDEKTTGGLRLDWGDYDTIEKLFFMMANREGFGNALAESACAVDAGFYPPEALRYRHAVKGLMQSDPHDARIIKAFALGLAVATRGMDHLRNRATLEINAKINDDPAYKRELYGAPVSAEPNAYDTKEVTVRKCENIYGVGDSVGMCRFTTKLFNSPNLPGYAEFVPQIKHVTGLEFTEDELDEIGLNITGLERLINHRLGFRKRDDTLPPRWFEEPITFGPFAGEKIDRGEFDAMLDRFYRISRLTDEGIPVAPWRQSLMDVVKGFAITVKVPDTLLKVPEQTVVIDEPVANIGQLLAALDRKHPGMLKEIDDSVYNVAVNDSIVIKNRDAVALKSGDVVEILAMFAGG